MKARGRACVYITCFYGVYLLCLLLYSAALARRFAVPRESMFDAVLWPVAIVVIADKFLIRGVWDMFARERLGKRPTGLGSTDADATDPSSGGSGAPQRAMDDGPSDA